MLTTDNTLKDGGDGSELEIDFPERTGRVPDKNSVPKRRTLPENYCL